MGDALPWPTGRPTAVGFIAANRPMSMPILATKLYIPPPRPKIVRRPRLIERLNEGLRQNTGFGRKLTLISAQIGRAHV